MGIYTTSGGILRHCRRQNFAEFSVCPTEFLAPTKGHWTLQSPARSERSAQPGGAGGGTLIDPHSPRMGEGLGDPGSSGKGRGRAGQGRASAHHVPGCDSEEAEGVKALEVLVTGLGTVHKITT